MTKKNRTIDHIIPMWVLVKYNMPWLEWDPNNFRIACIACNQRLGYEQTTLDKLHVSSEAYEMILHNAKWTLPQLIDKPLTY